MQYFKWSNNLDLKYNHPATSEETGTVLSVKRPFISITDVTEMKMNRHDC